MITESQRKARKKYLKNFEPVTLRVPIGKRESYKKHAESKCMSLNALIIELLEKDIEQGL